MRSFCNLVSAPERVADAARVGPCLVVVGAAVATVVPDQARLIRPVDGEHVRGERAFVAAAFAAARRVRIDPAIARSGKPTLRVRYALPAARIPAAVKVLEADDIPHREIGLVKKVPAEISQPEATEGSPRVSRSTEPALRLPIGSRAGIDFGEGARGLIGFTGDPEGEIGVRAHERKTEGLERARLQEDARTALE